MILENKIDNLGFGILTIHLPNFFVGVLEHRIQVAADGSIKQSWILRDDAQLGTQVTQTQCADVNPIDGYAAGWGFHQPKQSHHQTWFACELIVTECCQLISKLFFEPKECN